MKTASNLPSVQSVAANLKAGAEILMLPPGQHVIVLKGMRHDPVNVRGLTVPCAQITAAPPAPGKSRVQLVGLASGASSWLRQAGDSVTVNVPPNSGGVLMTTYSPPNLAESGLLLAVTPLTAPRPPQPETPRIVPMAHIARKGDVPGKAGAWLGEPESKLPFEAIAFSLQGLADGSTLEYCAVGPDGAQTPWVPAAKLCGSRGKNRPLLGFAVRLAGAGQGSYEVVYQATFASGHRSPMVRDGAVCRSANPRDPLVALRIGLVNPFAG